MSLPKAIEYVIRKIMNHGGQAYLVGGALRDHLLGRPIVDYDIAVSLLPDEITALFSDHRSWPTGKRFGTVTIEVDKMNIEITTFRQETLYSDSRHPDKVSFVTDINLDLSRRDFTINAMAWNPFQTSNFIDPFKGKEDLNQRIIRTVGSPYERFAEDPLRIMRGIRFSAQLNFQINEETKKAMTLCSKELHKVSAERIRDELNKILLSPHPDKGLLELQETGTLSILVTPKGETKENTLTLLNGQNTQHINHLEMQLPLRLAAFMSLLYKYEIGFNAPRSASFLNDSLRSLRYDNKTIAHVIKLMQAYESFHSTEVSPYIIRKLTGQVGMDDIRSILSWADIANKYDVQCDTRYDNVSLSLNKDDQEAKLKEAILILSRIQQNNDPVFFEQLDIKGDDVLSIGIGNKNPRLVGEALSLAYDWILQNPECNHKEYMLDKLKKHYCRLLFTGM
ncbi:MAG: hypothetical protein GX783_10775 [Clostridiales bacterium]|nr:hypothetical protein [Clostridiales bacterium]